MKRTVDVGDYALRCGLDEELIRTAARRIGTAASVSVFEDLGVQQAPNSTLCSYLNKLLWILTGNFAKRGGQHLHSSFGPLFRHTRDVGRTPVTGAPIVGGLIPSNVVPHEMLGDLMELAAGAAWGATTLIMKASVLSRAPFEKVLLYQLGVSAPLLAVGALLFGETISGMPSGLTWASVAYQILVISSASYLAWFALIQRYSASRLSAFTFLTPLFGVAAGHFALGEPITPAFALAVALVIGGLFLVNRPN